MMRRALLLALGITFTIQLLTAQNLTSGLVFYAPFDGNSVNLVDWVKPVNTGARMVTNKFGEANKAMYFDGENDLLDYGNILPLGRRNFSISVWVRINASLSTDDYPLAILAKGKIKDDIEEARSFELQATNFARTGNYFQIYASDNYAEEDTPAAQLPALEDPQEQWVHLVVLRFGTEIQYYLNGALISTEYHDELTNLNSNQPFTVGGSMISEKEDTEYFNGALDELRIYNRRLSERDIAELYLQFIGEPDSPPQTIQVSVFPNPTTRILKVDFQEAADRRVEIVDGAGRNMFYSRYADRRAELNVSGLPPGIYFLRIREGEQMVMHKFVKQGVVLP
ncbi:hypothetical protein CEQ90_03105 [Lewinellaceae bacterium SD302]|nr:hypothetical protein CEQ90_03105 [Lewinellaceae bacterium SD302]